MREQWPPGRAREADPIHSGQLSWPPPSAGDIPGSCSRRFAFQGKSLLSRPASTGDRARPGLPGIDRARSAVARERRSSPSRAATYASVAPDEALRAERHPSPPPAARPCRAALRSGRTRHARMKCWASPGPSSIQLNQRRQVATATGVVAEVGYRHRALGAPLPHREEAPSAGPLRAPSCATPLTYFLSGHVLAQTADRRRDHRDRLVALRRPVCPASTFYHRHFAARAT